MKKKLLALVLVVVLGITSVVGGTMAYLQDTDEAVNVMTLGNVDIKQHEYERKVGADGSYVTDDNGYVLAGFTQAKPLYPAVGTTTWDETVVAFAQLGDKHYNVHMDVFDEDSFKNAQDKFVFVENTGKSDAYVRTIIALEVGDANPDLVMTSYHSAWTLNNEIGTAEIDGNKYKIFEYVFNNVVEPGYFTPCNLAQVYLKSETTNEDVEALDGNGNGTYDILVFSQAVQVEGFSDATTALDTAFGDITTTNHPWAGEGNEPVIPVVLSADSGDAFRSALEEAVAAGEKNIFIDVNGADLSFAVDNYGAFLTSAMVPEGTTVTIANANIGSQSYGNDVDGTVIFQNCSFNNVGGAYSIHFDGGKGKVIFNNCDLAGWCSFGDAITYVELNSCTFDHNGTYGVLRFYQDAKLTNCTFGSNIEGIDSGEVTGSTIEFVNCSGVEGKIYNNTKGDTVYTAIWIVDGVDVSNTAQEW